MPEIPFECPRCDDVTVHEVLKESPNNLTLRCSECHEVRSTPPPRDSTVAVPLVVSEGDISRRDQVETPTDETVRVGDEFMLGPNRMLVTAIELQGGRPARKAQAPDIGTVFCKVFDTVILKLSVNEGDRTTSLEEILEPEAEVWVGEVREVQGRRLVVKTLKSDKNRTVRKGFLLARNVVRAFCDPAPRGAAPGERLDWDDIPSRGPRERRVGRAAGGARKRGPPLRGGQRGPPRGGPGRGGSPPPGAGRHGASREGLARRRG